MRRGERRRQCPWWTEMWWICKTVGIMRRTKICVRYGRSNGEASELVVAGALEMAGGVEEVLMELRRLQLDTPMGLYFYEL